MVHFVTHYNIITLITTITIDFHYYITTNYTITSIVHTPILEMHSDC